MIKFRKLHYIRAARCSRTEITRGVLHKIDGAPLERSLRVAISQADQSFPSQADLIEDVLAQAGAPASRTGAFVDDHVYGDVHRADDLRLGKVEALLFGCSLDHTPERLMLRTRN